MRLHDVTIVHADGSRTSLPALNDLAGCRAFAAKRKADDPTVTDVEIAGARRVT